MKIKKGDVGYICKRKKNVFIKTLLEFGIVVALLVLGIWQTGDRLNLLTVVAILSCLPASKALVELIMIFPHQSIQENKAKEIETNAEHLTKVFDMVFTSEKKIMPVDSIVISDNTICGYTSSAKVDANVVANHIKKYLNNNKFSKVSVKIFVNYQNYITRVQEMNKLMKAEEHETKAKEEAIRGVILNLSL